MSTIVAATNVDGFFHEIVETAMRTRKVEATDGATHYLVGLLSDYTRPADDAGRTMDRPLTFLLDEALHTNDLGERFEKLRTLGDGVLYGLGFFGDHFEARGVAPGYLKGIGAKAYGSARLVLNTGGAAANDSTTDIFGELAAKFDAFVGVMTEVADCTLAIGAIGAKSSKGVLKAYERWLKTGSDSLAEALSGHGLVQARGKGSIQ
ncbi:MAG: hypothetical protein HOO96_33120 [Polyangiaceae bacterium]|nr:hypothetical protein [Polyangiaceae bacterium]